MKHAIGRTLGALALVGAFASAPALLAQRGKGCGGACNDGPRYDATKEVVLTGTVDAVTTMEGRMGMAGIHVELNAAGAPVAVHLGPSSYLKEKGLELAKGDTVEVTGARLQIDGVDSLLAREVKKGSLSVTLRDERGMPLWSRGGRGMRRRG